VALLYLFALRERFRFALEVRSHLHRVARLLGLALFVITRVVLAGNVQPDSYAWSESAGWINFAPSSGPGVTVSDTAVTGTAWAENLGWVVFSPNVGGVSNDGAGKLAGFAWLENGGWVDFAPALGGVRIDAAGKFSGTAWGENVGWINFSTPTPVMTTWRSTVRIFVDGFE